MARSRLRLASAALVAASTLALAGCEFSIGTPTVSKSELEKQVTSSVADNSEDGAKFDVSCEGPLEGKVKATQDCLVEDDAGDTGLHVVVTSVDGSDVEFEMNPFIRSDDLEKAIRGLADQQGITVDSLDCPDELPGEVDATVTCSGTPTDTVGDLTVTVTEVKGLRVNFNVESAG